MSTYSQYSYYQYQQQQPQQQHEVPAMTWDGTRWVPASSAPAPAASMTMTMTAPAPPPTPQAPPGLTPPPANSAPSTFVTAYSTYYQRWTAQSEEQRRLASTLPPGSQARDEAERRAQWAVYYADQSSRAAHYYNGLVQAGQGGGAAGGGGAGLQQQMQQQVQQQQQQQPAQRKKSRWGTTTAPSSEPSQPTAASATSTGSNYAPAPAAAGGSPPSPPESMKRYVHRCLARCSTDAEKARVQAAVETVISDKIRSGKLHDTDWDSLECVPVPGGAGDGDNGERSERERRTERSGPERAPSSRHQQQSHQPTPPPPKRSSSGPISSPSRVHKRFRTGRDDYGYYGSSGGDGGSVGSAGSGGSGRGGYYGPSSGGRDRRGGGGRDRSSYYGPSSSFGEEQADFISLSSSPSPSSAKKSKNKSQKNNKHGKQSNKQQSKTQQHQQEANDGFVRSSAALTARQSRFAGRGGLSDAALSTLNADPGNVERYMGKSVIGGRTKPLDDADFEAMTVKGTCTVLEKQYLRLTAPPRADLVRPKPVLEEHLANLKRMWLQPEEERGGGTGKKRDYEWFCSQFKAVRQDLTVQRIFDAFAVDVYETHARIALERGDLNEYNQCQTQLKELYDLLAHESEKEEKAKADNKTALDAAVIAAAEGGNGNKDKNKKKTGLENQHEFIAYRIIYYVFLTNNKKYQGGSSDLFKIMLSLSPEQREDAYISHALKVRVAVAEFDYHAFFRLQDTCPNMGAYLMDYLIPATRQAALQRIHKAFRPSVPVDYVLTELGFDHTDPDDVEEGKAWLVSCGCNLSADGKTFVTKDSVLKESDLTDKKSSLI